MPRPTSTLHPAPSSLPVPWREGARDESWPLKREQPGQGHLTAEAGAEKVTCSRRGGPQLVRKKHPPPTPELLGWRRRSLRRPRKRAVTKQSEGYNCAGAKKAGWCSLLVTQS